MKLTNAYEWKRCSGGRDLLFSDTQRAPVFIYCTTSDKLSVLALVIDTVVPLFPHSWPGFESDGWDNIVCDSVPPKMLAHCARRSTNLSSQFYYPNLICHQCLYLTLQNLLKSVGCLKNKAHIKKIILLF